MVILGRSPPEMRNAVADASTDPVSLADVLSKEHEEIMAVRTNRVEKFNQGDARPVTHVPERPVAKGAPRGDDAPDTRKEDPHWAKAIKQAHEANFVGLAFSGGGIRSATFNLGVLQALADMKLLCRIDYLSTVSGGGYIGSWLVAWTKRLGSFARLQEEISTHRVHLKGDKEQPPVRFLRVFSNYLTPKLGFFSGDTWSMISIYLRNLLLNLTILFGMLAAFLLLPRVASWLAAAAVRLPHIGHTLIAWGSGMLLISFLMILVNMEYLGVRRMKWTPKFTEQKWVLLLVSAPLFATAVVTALWFARPPDSANHKVPMLHAIHEYFPYQNSVLAGSIVYTAIWVLAWLGELLLYEPAKQTQQEPPRETSPLPRSLWETLIAPAAALFAGALAGWLLALTYDLQYLKDPTRAITFCVPLVMAVFLLAGVLHIGLMGVVFRDWKREWWGRLGGWLLLFAILWLALFWLALFFPSFLSTSPAIKSIWQQIAAKYLTPAWIVATIGTVLAGNSKSSGKSAQPSWIDRAIEVGPYVFVAGLLCWLSFGLDWFLKTRGSLWWTLPVCVAVTLVMAWRVDINQFAMHMFYRNRLVSCYLGASNGHRCANLFTGFDPADDLPLKDLRCNGSQPYDGPYPVLNMSLNLVKGKDLAWQERKAESFVMTPYYCGYDVWLEEQDSPLLTKENNPPNEKTGREDEGKTLTANHQGGHTSTAAKHTHEAKKARANSAQREKEGVMEAIERFIHPLERYGYRATEEYAFPVPKFNGPNLGVAMATSGAAVSPNMGFYSSAPVAFLLTVFNVRLGQWMGNPRHRRTSRRATPRLGLWWLVNELLGGTNDQAAYVYLSDGGHFDNMGLYELVKRRCGLIVLCDAEADPNYTFSGLGNAVGKCRIDLGIDIDLDTSDIAPKSPNDPSQVHCAIGKIHYENVDREARMGTIVYFKASLTGDEPADVSNYKKDHPSFPHESTAEQWFCESQFESYRELGYHELFSSIKGTPAASSKPLERQLHGILVEFGFEVNHLREAKNSTQKAVSGASASKPAQRATSDSD